jgi:hypothetical protein
VAFDSWNCFVTWTAKHEAFIKCAKGLSIIGDMTKATLSKWKWHLGTGKNPVSNTKYKYTQDKSIWFKSIRTLMARYKIQINTGEAKYPLQQEGDKYIMVCFMAQEMRYLNHCRLCFNVIRISDITIESGNIIDHTIMALKTPPHQQLDLQVNQSILDGPYGSNL